MDSPSVGWLQAIGAIAQGGAAIASLILSAVIWKASSRRAKIEYTRAIQEGWNQYNALILSRHELTEIADRLLKYPPTSARSKRYVTYSLLNMLEATYLGQQAGLIFDSFQSRGMLDVLDPLLTDPEVLTCIRSGGFHQEFVDLCEERLRQTSVSAYSNLAD